MAAPNWVIEYVIMSSHLLMLTHLVMLCNGKFWVLKYSDVDRMPWGLGERYGIM